MTELKPCPFCGSVAHVEEVSRDMVKFSMASIIKVENLPEVFYTIGCYDPECIAYCEHSGRSRFLIAADNPDILVERWNRREKNES